MACVDLHAQPASSPFCPRRARRNTDVPTTGLAATGAVSGPVAGGGRCLFTRCLPPWSAPSEADWYKELRVCTPFDERVAHLSRLAERPGRLARTRAGAVHPECGSRVLRTPLAGSAECRAARAGSHVHNAHIQS